MRKIAKSELNSLFAAIAERAKLYVPQDTAGGAKFSEWKNGKKCSAALNTVRSAKDFFFPQSETMMKFKLSGKNIEIEDIRKKVTESDSSLAEKEQRLNENNIVSLDEERKAAMVSNLLVVLCGNKEAQPIVNSGSIY